MSIETFNNDPFILRTLEYWLDTANELSYQPLFCSWLSINNYILKYSIKNTNFEQGKDVVAINHSGVPCGFQLKGGNIDLKRWRSEVKPEIEALIETSLQHPDIDKNLAHKSYLVTNGEISDSVRDEIIHLNEKRWINSPLVYWSRGDLISMFQSMASGALPSTAKKYQQLTNLMFQDGKSLCRRDEIYEFLYSILDIDQPQGNAGKKRNIAAAIFYTALITANFRKLDNFVSTLHIYIILAALVLHLVDKYDLEDRYWLEEFLIIKGEIAFTGQQLENYFDNNELSALDEPPHLRHFLVYRKNAFISTWLAYKFYLLIGRDVRWRNGKISGDLSSFQQSLAVWGEASFLSYAMLGLLRKYLGREDELRDFIHIPISMIIAHNGRNAKSELGLFPPYIDIAKFINDSTDVNQPPYGGSTLNSSYTLEYLIEIAARAGLKKLVEEHWREISFINCESFIPDNPVDIYLNRCEYGKNLTRLQKTTESWKNIIAAANSRDGQDLPASLRRFPELIPLLLCVLPHRANPDTLGFIDILGEKNKTLT